MGVSVGNNSFSKLFILPTHSSEIQIVAQGRRNIYPNWNSDTTLFQVTHKLFTSFAEDMEENDFSAENVGFGQKASAKVSCYSDLMSDIMLDVALPAIAAFATVFDASVNTVAAADKAAYWMNANRVRHRLRDPD